MHNSLYCKIFIDSNLDYDELFELVMKYVSGRKEAVTYISADWCSISVQRNKEYSTERYMLNPNDFLYWKNYLDIEPTNIEEGVYINKLSDMLVCIRQHCKNAIAACDFEDELI